MIDEDDLVVEGGGEDRAEDDLVVADGDRLDAGLLHPGDPLPDVLGEDVDHPHGAELGHEVFIEGVGVALSGGRLHLVVGKPRVLDVLLESLSPTPGIAQPSFGDLGLCSLPGFIGFLLAREGARRPLGSLEVSVVGGVVPLARSQALPREAHSAHLKIVWTVVGPWTVRHSPNQIDIVRSHICLFCWAFGC